MLFTFVVVVVPFYRINKENLAVSVLNRGSQETGMERWSLFKEKVLNKDFLKKMAKNGPYLVLILSSSPYFSKSIKLFCH